MGHAQQIIEHLEPMASRQVRQTCRRLGDQCGRLIGAPLFRVIIVM
jgi:hypothetical protein